MWDALRAGVGRPVPMCHEYAGCDLVNEGAEATPPPTRVSRWPPWHLSSCLWESGNPRAVWIEAMVSAHPRQRKYGPESWPLRVLVAHSEPGERETAAKWDPGPRQAVGVAVTAFHGLSSAQLS